MATPIDFSWSTKAQSISGGGGTGMAWAWSWLKIMRTATPRLTAAANDWLSMLPGADSRRRS